MRGGKPQRMDRRTLNPPPSVLGVSAGTAKGPIGEFIFRVRFLEEDDELDFKAASKQEMVDWVLAVDGLCMRNFGTHMDSAQKVPFALCEKYTGVPIKLFHSSTSS